MQSGEIALNTPAAQLPTHSPTDKLRLHFPSLLSTFRHGREVVAVAVSVVAVVRSFRSFRPACSRSYSISSSPSSSPPPFAFAFDIDGVLLRVDKPIPGAADALRFLYARNIPFILLTNGGGRREADRVADLQTKLGFGDVPVLTTANFVQSHTPFQELVDGHDAEVASEGGNGGGKEGGEGGKEGDSEGGGKKGHPTTSSPGLRDKTILVTGSDASKARSIALHYGFQSVVTPADLLAAHPSLWPFDPLLTSVYRDAAQPLPKPLATSDADCDDDHLQIAAAFVFNDPRDWALDIQLLTDLLQSRRGYLGTLDPEALKRDSSVNTPRLFFSNGDLLWATTYHLPRFGQGAFAAAVAGVWAQLAHGQPLLGVHGKPGKRAVLLGKPHQATYRYAERTLLRYYQKLVSSSKATKTTKTSLSSPKTSSSTPAAPSTVYMIGDNPESDIAGANQYDSAHNIDWCSVLVSTGVYSPERDGTTAEHLRHRPRAIVSDVAAAVRWALQREGYSGF